MATRADIEIAVKGIQQVENAKKKIRDLNREINKSNKQITNQPEKAGVVKKGNKTAVGAASQVRSINTLNKNLARATRNFNRVALGTEDAAEAAIQLKKAEDALNKALAEQNKLLGRNTQLSGSALQKKTDIARGKFAGSGPGVFGPQPRQTFRQRIGATRGFDTQSALISGAFPLLFGQGPIASIAGGIGGGVGGMFGGMGGFAGGIAATAAVQIISNALDEISKLGQAMGAFTQNTQALTTAMGLQGSVQEAQLKRIERTQGKTAAFNAAMKMMENRIGQSGVRKIKEFGETTRVLGVAFSTALLKLQAFGAGIANFIAKILLGEKQLKDAEVNQTIKDAAAGGNEEAKSLLERERIINETGFRKVGHGGSRTIAKSGTKEKLEELNRDKQIFAVRNKISLANDEVISKSRTLVEEKRKEFELNEKINKLVAGGMNPSLAKSLATLEKTFDEEQKILEQKALQAEEDYRKSINNKTDLETQTKLKDEFIAHTLELGKHNKLRADGIKLTKDLHNQTDLVGKAFEDLSESINNDIKEGIKGLIKGTSTLGDLLNNVADRFLDVALNQALFGSILGSKGEKGGGLLGAIGLFANGGRPPVGRPSIVGERGPELFVPRTSGTIVPNNKLGGGNNTSVVVNVDASGSDVQGDDAGAKELGGLISVAVQSELVRQQRPGGLLSSIR